jgi:hypothetical protein
MIRYGFRGIQSEGKNTVRASSEHNESDVPIT